MRGALVALVALLTLVGCGSSTETRVASSPPSSSTTSSTTIAPSPPSPPPAPPPPAATPAPAGCKDAPKVVVDQINAAFTNGEHLEHAQSIDGPQAMTYVGGNIFNADGTKESSQDSWVLKDGQVYALTSDARRHTVLPDGRDLGTGDWSQYNDAVGKCVGNVERKANQGG